MNNNGLSNLLARKPNSQPLQHMTYNIQQKAFYKCIKKETDSNTYSKQNRKSVGICLVKKLILLYNVFVAVVRISHWLRGMVEP